MPLFHDIDESGLNPGDHIYVWRTLYLYSHHGIVAEKKRGVWQIIHFTGDGRKSKSTARIRITSLEEFKDNDDIRLYRYDSSLAVCRLKRSGTCCPVPSDPVEDVLRRARECLDEGLPEDGEYNLLVNNCEHFCLYCKLGPNYKALQRFSQA